MSRESTGLLETAVVGNGTDCRGNADSPVPVRSNPAVHRLTRKLTVGTRQGVQDSIPR
jgi:hypothetical protein